MPIWGMRKVCGIGPAKQKVTQAARLHSHSHTISLHRPSTRQTCGIRKPRFQWYANNAHWRLTQGPAAATNCSTKEAGSLVCAADFPIAIQHDPLSTPASECPSMIRVGEGTLRISGCHKALCMSLIDRDARRVKWTATPCRKGAADLSRW